ncbi:MAG TPA: EAL domain-containing protein [Polyangiaceae bacterium]|nr:EAL domain-containing protein [Polyangiaceae bacterium]
MRIVTISEDQAPTLGENLAVERFEGVTSLDHLVTSRVVGGSDDRRVDVVLVDGPKLAADPGALERLRRNAPTLTVVSRCGDGEHVPQLLLGADATCALDDEAATVAKIGEMAARARQDRLRWPRSLGERRALIVAPSDEGSTLAEAVAETGFTAELATTLSSAVTALRDSDPHVVLVRHDDDGAAMTMRRAVRGLDHGLGLVLVTHDEQEAAAVMRAGAECVLIPPLDVDVIGAALERAWLRWARLYAAATLTPCLLAVGISPRDAAALAAPPTGRAIWRVDPVATPRDARARLAEVPVCGIVVHGRLPLRELLLIRASSSAPIVVWGGDDGMAGLFDGALPEHADPPACRAAVAPLVARGLERVTHDTVTRRLHEVDGRRMRLLQQVADAQAELERLETVDHVTETLNRQGLEIVLQRSLAAARRAGGSVAACLIDCDDFVRVESHFGRGAGDRVLAGVARRIQQTLRRSDVIGRVGVDTFLLLLPRTRLAEAGLVAERARIAVSSEALQVEDGAVQASVSVGVVAVPWDTASLEEVVASAEIALADSKAAGKDQVSGADETLGAEMRDLVAELVRGESLRVLAQPIVSLVDDEVVAYEMLTRGREGIFEAPEQFLRMARDNGVLTAVDLQCLRACVVEAKHVGGGLTVHVNLFPTTLLDSAIEELIALLDEPESPMCVELSEEQFVGDPRKLLDRVGALRSAGIRVAIDDVGKGRGTLDSVMLLEPEVVKIDKDLIGGASRDVRKERLCRRLVTLAAALGSEVVAEGVETEADLNLVRELEVPLGQGFLWARPGPYGDV